MWHDRVSPEHSPSRASFDRHTTVSTGSLSRLAIVTGDLAPELSEDGTRLATALANRDVAAEPVLWTDPSVEWSSYDAALVRSCWDYPDDVGRFRAMLDELETAGIPVCNPLRALRWNLHKSYLLALADAGVRIPQTTLVEQGTAISLEGVLETHGWADAVVKPAVGAMSTNVWRTSSATAACEDRFAALVAEGDVIVQQFVPAITEGERSIVFFGGDYSHAWNSLTTDGDVTSFDGVDASYEPSAAIREQALDAVRGACDCLGLEETQLPYARVDYAERNADLQLMELELIEPYLGFDRGENAVGRFCEALRAFFARRGLAVESP